MQGIALGTKKLGKLMHPLTWAVLCGLSLGLIAQETPRPKPKPKPGNAETPQPKTKPRSTSSRNPAKSAAPRETESGAGPAVLLIETDLDCRIRLDGENVGIFKAGAPQKVRTILGQHILEATSLEGGYQWRQNLTLEKTGQLIVQPELLRQKQAAEAAVQSRKLAAEQEAAIQQRKSQEAAEMAAVADQARRDGFAQIPSGSFTMGDSSDGPPHKVTITKWFEMGKYEVTQAFWEATMGNNPSSFKGANRPVENVSWEDVQDFLSRLNARDTPYHYRLPTEAEWEYAARAGTTGDYAGNLGEMGWYDANSGRETHPVGQKKPNAWGLYDVHGNVWEWCQDWYGSYSAEAAVDPVGPNSGSYRVNRGGGWGYAAAGCRSAYRRGSAPGLRGVSLGFRLIRQGR